MSITAAHQPAAATTDTKPTPRSCKRRAGGVALTVLGTCAVQLVGTAAGADYLITDSTGSAVINLPTTAAVTLIVSLLGWATLALLERLTRHATLIWRALAVAIVAASMIPIPLVEATTATRIALVLVHLAVGAVLIPALTRPSRLA